MRNRKPTRKAGATPAIPPPSLTLQQALDVADQVTPLPTLAHAALQRLKAEIQATSEPPTQDRLSQIGQSLATVAGLAAAPELQPLLGSGMRQEMSTLAAGFRQRFPLHWPSAQQTLPLD